MAKVYYVRKHGEDIAEEELLNSTDKTVTTSGGRSNWISECRHYFKTESEARQHVLNRLKKKVKELRTAEQVLQELQEKWGMS